MKLLSVLNKGFTSSLLLLVVASIKVLGQESSAIIDEDLGSIVIDKGPFYAQLWFWVVIGLVFLVLLIVLVRSGNTVKNKKQAEDQKEE